jgi:hypothetical protein
VRLLSEQVVRTASSYKGRALPVDLKTRKEGGEEAGKASGQKIAMWGQLAR